MEHQILTKELKLEHWGPGEWVDEPDYLEFEHNGIKCKILRTVSWDGFKGDYLFGGYLCGYICIQKDHSFYEKHYDDIDLECHGGLTFSGIADDGSYWIGFDCAHSMDLVPSTERFMQNSREHQEEIKKIKEQLKNSSHDFSYFFERKYRNIEYVKSECINLVDQLLAVSSPASSPL